MQKHYTFFLLFFLLNSVCPAQTVAPVANFNYLTIIPLGEIVDLIDLSSNAPTTWHWKMNGAFPSSSNQQNQSIVFNTAGNYTITLIVSNSAGSDTFWRNIQVVNERKLCSNNQVSTAAVGKIYDSGGATANYQPNENCSFRIYPGACTDSIRLTFNVFNTESGFDYLKVYDGYDATTGTLLLNVSGTTLPPSVKANSESMFLQWNSDNSFNPQGFEATWQAYQHSAPPPIANFSFSPNNAPLLDTIYFQDLSTIDASAWLWDFGDGKISLEKNPKHQYTQSGTFNVMLVASSCAAADTIWHSVNIQASPNVQVSNTSFSVNLGCNDSIILPLYIQNVNGGLLNWQVLPINEPKTNILAWTYGVQTDNTVAAINQYFTHYNYTYSNTTSPTQLQSALQGKNCLLIPSQTYGQPGVTTAMSPIIQDFVYNDGTVIVCGDNGKNTWQNIGFFTGAVGASIFNGAQNLPIIDNTSPLTDNLTTILSVPSNTYYTSISNSNKILVASYLGYDVVTFLKYGAGKAIYLGFDYSSYNNSASRIIANAVKWSAPSNVEASTTITNTAGSLAMGDMTTIYVKISAKNLKAGLDTLHLQIQTNDAANPILNIPVFVNVTAMPCVDFLWKKPAPECSAVTNFIENSKNLTTSWLWKFGDGTTSTLQHPSHTYATGGNYSVTLIASNAAGTDSVTKMFVMPTLIQTVTPACYVKSSPSANNNYGITKVQLNDISRTSSNAKEGYRDFSCTDFTNLYVGNQYPYLINTSGSNNIITTWIDFDNDGAFSAAEQVAYFPTGSSTYQSIITIPSVGVVLNTPLRMRVYADYVVTTNPCKTPLYGQAEDYSVMIIDTTLSVENAFASEISLYPNPFQTEFTLEFRSKTPQKEANLLITNVLGQVIFAQKYVEIEKQKITIPANFPAGIYNLSLKIGDKYYGQKLVKE